MYNKPKGLFSKEQRHKDKRLQVASSRTAIPRIATHTTVHHDEDTITDGSLLDWWVGRCEGGWRLERGCVVGRRRGFLLAGAS